MKLSWKVPFFSRSIGLGVCFFNAGKLTKAKGVFEKALELVSLFNN
jgi:hypothetical protein